MAGWVPRGSCGGRVGPAGKTSTDRVGRGVVPAVGVESGSRSELFCKKFNAESGWL